jgi:hypothetical protein
MNSRVEIDPATYCGTISDLFQSQKFSNSIATVLRIKHGTYKVRSACASHFTINIGNTISTVHCC